MKNKFFIFLSSLFFFACTGSEEIEKSPATGNYYDKNKPIEIQEIVPTWGNIDQLYIIRGNFPADTSQINVYFDTRKSVVLGSDGHEIFGMVPKLLPGYNQISVVIGNDSIVPDNIQFKYYQTQSLTKIVGQFGEDNYLEGSLDEALLQHPTGLGTVSGQNGDNIILVEGEWTGRLSLISLDDNKMIKVADVGWIGGPAVTSTRNKFYVINRADNRSLYSFSREDGWITTVEGMTITNEDLPGSVVGGLTFAEDDRYLYAMSGEGYLISIDLEEKTFEKILNKDDWEGVNIGTGWMSYLIYSKYHKCFFASFQDANGIFKITNDTAGNWKVEKFAGFNAGNNVVLGHRLQDAVLRNPTGMAVNQDGEIYFTSRNGHCILKIKGDIVSLVAGKPDSWGKTVGDPLESQFDQPLSIVTDHEDNFFIGDGSNRVIRKLTIE